MWIVYAAVPFLAAPCPAGRRSGRAKHRPRERVDQDDVRRGGFRYGPERDYESS
jgi:hypothetical protein